MSSALVSSVSSVSSVSTEAVAAEERLAFWEQYNAEALVGLTCTTYEDDGLLARQLNLDLDGVRIADIAGNAHVIERAPRLVRSRPKDATFLSVLLEGEAFFYHPGGCVTLAAGDVLVYATDRPYLFGFGTAMRQLLVDVPRTVLAERYDLPAPSSPLKVAADGPGAASVSARALRRRLLEVVADPGAAGPAGRDDVLDLARGVVTGTGTAGSAARLLAAKTYIAEHLRDPGLSADRIAAALGVSARHLNRAFATEATTVAQYVQHRRLDSARADLVAPAGHRIADVASRWGFASQAHFTRLFRARFGCTPSEARATGRPGAP